jgi:hypothetical protein
MIPQFGKCVMCNKNSKSYANEHGQLVEMPMTMYKRDGQLLCGGCLAIYISNKRRRYASVKR